MKLNVGITLIPSDEIEAAATEAARSGLHVLPLETRGACDKEAIFSAFRRDLPMDPPLHSSRSWEALSDSLFGGLFGLAAGPHVVIVWRDAAWRESRNTGDLAEVMSILEQVAHILNDQHATRGNAKMLSVLVASDPQK